MGVACLAFEATDVLSNFFIAGFDFPADAVEFDNLLGGPRPVGGEESDPSAFPENPYDTDLATQVFQHYALIIGEHVALLAIEKNRNRLRFFTQHGGQIRSTSQSCTLLASSASLTE